LRFYQKNLQGWKYIQNCAAQPFISNRKQTQTFCEGLGSSIGRMADVANWLDAHAEQ
jgi:hypothetical protein